MPDTKNCANNKLIDARGLKTRKKSLSPRTHSDTRVIVILCFCWRDKQTNILFRVFIFLTAILLEGCCQKYIKYVGPHYPPIYQSVYLSIYLYLNLYINLLIYPSF